MTSENNNFEIRDQPPNPLEILQKASLFYEPMC